MKDREGGWDRLRLTGVPEPGRRQHGSQVDPDGEEHHRRGREGDRVVGVGDPEPPSLPVRGCNLALSGAVRTSMYTHRHLGVHDDTAHSSRAPHLMARGPVGRRGAGVLDLIRRLDAGTILTTLLVLGLVLRAFIAAVYLPRSGLSNDIGAFAAWGIRLASIGPGAFYEAGYFSDYPPGYMYVLWVLGTIGKALTPMVGQDATVGLVKIPGILADVGVAWLLFVICRRWGGELIERTRIGVSPEGLGLLAAGVYLFNPATVFVSSVWGQIDSVGTLILLATIYALARGWIEVAALGAVVALLVKFQFAFLVPIVAIVGLRRHLFGRSSDPELDGHRDPLRVLTALAVGIGALTLLMLPFGMVVYAPLAGGDPHGVLGILPAADPNRSLVGKLFEAANTYQGLTINAFNLWRNPWSGLGDTFQRGDDSGVALIIGSVVLNWQQVGALLFAAVALLAMVLVARRDDLRGILLASLLLAVAFFVLPTRVHERYLFPALALAAPLLLSGRVWPWIYGALSLSVFANIYWVYSEDWSWTGRIINPGAFGQPMPQDPFLTATLLSDAGIWLLSLLIVGVLGVVAWRAVRYAMEPDIVVAAEAPVPRTAPAPRAADWAADRWERTEPQPAGASPISWLRRNPADAYLREPTRRLNRRDALLVLGLFVFALVFRLWRLDVPRGDHFDEVYHARSATEWLSNWQNGWDRDVYEWTHPMLAKYLIAGGILLADPNKVVGSSDLDGPSPSIAIAPQRSSLGRDRSVVFTAAGGGTTIVASDAESGDELARWNAGGPVAGLAYDPEAPRLLVGRADMGTVETYELAGLLASPDGRAPPAGPPIQTDLTSVSQIELPRDAGVILLRGPDGIAILDRLTDEVRASGDGTYGGVAWVSATEEDPDFVVATDPARNAVVFLDTTTLQPALNAEGDETGVVAIDEPLTGPLAARGSGDDQQVLALTGGVAANDEHPATPGGLASIDGDTQLLTDVVPLPGAPSLIGYQAIANIVYVAGVSAAGEPVVWPIEPHVDGRNDTSAGLAAFDQTTLAAPALAMAFDISADSQADDHGRLILSTGDGALVRLDAGSNAFAWRLAGVVFGALLVVLVYLLAATMFSRPRIGLLAAGFVAIDGMSYVMSRIAMNDIFVAVFIVAAYLVFWQIWSGRWARSAWWALPLVGRTARPRRRHEVGWLLRAGRHLGPRPGTLEPGPPGAGCAGRVRHRGRGHRCAVAVPGDDAACAGHRADDRPRAADPVRSRERQAGATGHRPRRRWGGAGLRHRLRPGGRWHARQCRRGPVRLPRPRCPGRLGGLADAGGRRGPHRVACLGLPARSTLRRAMAATGRDGRLRLAVDRRLPARHPASGVCPELPALPPARPSIRRPRCRTGLWLVARGAARADVRVPLRSDRRPRQLLAMVELAAGPQADLVLQRHLRRRADRGHLQRWQPDPLLGGCARRDRLRRAGLDAALAGPGADRRRLRVPAGAVDPDRARHLRLPLPDRRRLRDDRGRLRRGRAPPPARLARAGDRLPGPRRGGRDPGLPVGFGAADAGLVHQRGARVAALELRLPVPRSTAGATRRPRQRLGPEARRGGAGGHRGRRLVAHGPQLGTAAHGAPEGAAPGERVSRRVSFGAITRSHLRDSG